MKQHTLMLGPEHIVSYLAARNDELDTLILCKSAYVNLVTSDQALYEALGSLKAEGIDIPKLVKLLEVTHVHSWENTKGEPRKILTPERVKEILGSTISEKEDKNG
ncbi:MAG: hypothetical protein ABH879_08870 [archaeon]